jgi:hypothetical protein
LNDSFTIFWLGCERPVTAKFKVGFQHSAGFHAVPANAGYVSGGALQPDQLMQDMASRFLGLY